MLLVGVQQWHVHPHTLTAIPSQVFIHIHWVVCAEFVSGLHDHLNLSGPFSLFLPFLFCVVWVAYYSLVHSLIDFGSLYTLKPLSE